VGHLESWNLYVESPFVLLGCRLQELSARLRLYLKGLIPVLFVNSPTEKRRREVLRSTPKLNEVWKAFAKMSETSSRGQNKLALQAGKPKSRPDFRNNGS
jgi:hypothetical protein